MIPPIDLATGNLPPGEHEADWREFYERYGTTPRRIALLRGLANGLNLLAAAGIPRAYVDGSFVTAKEAPGDFDVCWDTDRYTNTAALDPVFLDCRPPRLQQKARFGGEFLPAEAIADARGTPYRRFFQTDRYTDQPKGIVVISLRA